MQAPKSGFYFAVLVLAGIDDQCLDALIPWRLENGHILHLLCHFSHIRWNTLIRNHFPSSTV